MKRNFGESSLDNLVSVLQNPTSSDDMLCDAARLLAELGDKRAVEPLTHRLVGQPDPPWVREALITALGAIALISGSGSPGIGDLLLEILLSSEAAGVREAAALTLGSLGDTRAVEPLIKILESGGPSLTYACVAALGMT